jgi:hypothetical protein
MIAHHGLTTDPVWSAHIQMIPDQGFDLRPALFVTLEDLNQAFNYLN